MFGQSGAHEIRPDRQRRICAGQAKLRTVVESNPHYTDKVWCVTSKPSVTRGSRLPCHITFETTRPHFCGGTAINHIFHKRCHHVGNVRTHHIVLLRRRRGNGDSASSRNAIDSYRRSSCSQRGKGRISRRDL